MAQYNWTNCPKAIKGEISTLQTEFKTILQEHITGLYLYGSLASGGFNPERSDINLLVLTDHPLTSEHKRQLTDLFLRISKAPSPVEATFINEQALRPLQQPLTFEFHYDETMRERYQQDLRTGAWQQWHEQAQQSSTLALDIAMIRESGICIAGLPIAEAFPEIPTSTIQAILRTNLQQASNERLRNPVDFVLNGCRIYVALKDGKLISKDAAGLWGLTNGNLPEKFLPLIHQAISLYRGERLGRPAGRQLLDDFAHFLDEQL
jgi:streptomycin 3"-adenylyltransferase